MHIHKHTHVCTYIHTYIGFLPYVRLGARPIDRRAQPFRKPHDDPTRPLKGSEMALPIQTFHALRHINVLCIFRSLLLLLVWQGVRHPYGTLDTGHTRIELRATNLIAAMLTAHLPP